MPTFLSCIITTYVAPEGLFRADVLLNDDRNFKKKCQALSQA